MKRRRPKLLDLCCAAGGAAVGYWRAGFDVIGVDIKPQPRYPFEFVQMDALTLLDEMSTGRNDVVVDAIHASPPCQAFSTQTADPSRHPRLIVPIRKRLVRLEKPFVIENVEGARKELYNPTRLCGSMFGLDVRRHRYFETDFIVAQPKCAHELQTPRFRSLDVEMVKAGRLASVVGVHGHLNYPGEFALRCAAMGIDWMTNDELVEAIPPAYTEYIGRQLIKALRR